MTRRTRKDKSAAAVSIIGGADGPTSVFIAEKSKKQSLKEKLQRMHYRKKKKKAVSAIKAEPHSFDELALYLQHKYHASERSKQSVSYQEQYKCVKESLILRYRPKLLGDLAKIPDLKGRDRTSIEEALCQVKLRSEAAQAVSDEQFPMDFHLYRICTKRGMIEFAVERRWGLISCSYSGSKKEMKRLKAIYRDVYLYYGVTEEDIRNQTDRYQELVSVLAA